MTSASSASVAPSSVPGGQRSVVATAGEGWPPRRPYLEGNAPSLPPQGRDDLRVVRISRPIKPCTRCARLVNPFAPPSGL